METYTVKQIAEMLGTNPETVRRWIRDDKLKAVQVSRKDGNVITEDEFKRFLSATPKYLSRLKPIGIGLIAAAPAFGIPALVGGVVAGAVLDRVNDNSNADLRIPAEDFQRYLIRSIEKMHAAIEQKQALIRQTQAEISEIENQIDQYRFLLDHEELITESLIMAGDHAQKDGGDTL